MTRSCESCGATAEPSDQFCGRCGAALPALPPSAVEPDSTAEQPHQAVTAEATALAPPATAGASSGVPSGRRFGARSVVAVAAVAALVAGGITYLVAGEDSPSVASVEATSTTVTTSAPGSETTIAAPATTTTAPTPRALVSQYTDTDASHWRPSDAEPPQDLQARVFDDSRWQLVADFPVTMNGCDSRQIAVRWRSLGLPVIAGIAFFKDSFDTSPVEPNPVGEPAQEGSMLLSGCEQPAFVAQPGESISDIAVSATVNSPVA